MVETFIPLSTNLDQIVYDPDLKLMTITFKSGDVWEYSNVPAEVYRGIQHAPSAGSYPEPDRAVPARDDYRLA
jgi:hypothetical protein